MAALELSLGPMFSGKSLDLIQKVSAQYYADPVHLGMYQPLANTRDSGISSRIGPIVYAKKISSLTEILEDTYTSVGVDELHFFQPSDSSAVCSLLRRGVTVRLAGLDKDYQGRLFPIIAKLLELPDVHVTHLAAACSCCKEEKGTYVPAYYTQILRQGQPVLSGLNSAKVQDPQLLYEARCADCFVSEYLP